MNPATHPDEHLAKAVCSLSTFATRWGGRPSGYYAGGSESGLESCEVLDGMLFVCAAGLTFDRLGWAHESGKSLAVSTCVFIKTCEACGDFGEWGILLKERWL